MEGGGSKGDRCWSDVDVAVSVDGKEVLVVLGVELAWVTCTSIIHLSDRFLPQI